VNLAPRMHAQIATTSTPAVVRLQAPRNMVEQTRVLSALEEVLKLAKSPLGPNDWVCEGNALSRYLSLTFKGPAPASKARQFIEAMKDDQGHWRRLLVPCPAGGEVQVFANPDRSRADTKCAQMLRRALAGWREWHPTIAIHPHFGDRELRKDWQLVARAVWDDATERATIAWNEDFLRRNGASAPLRTHSLGPQRPSQSQSPPAAATPVPPPAPDAWARYQRTSGKNSSRGRSPAPPAASSASAAAPSGARRR